jgi:hypothetical protein
MPRMAAIVEATAVRAPSAPGAARPRSDAIAEHLVRCVNATAADDAPFQHIFLQNVFPADVYGEIMANLPQQNAYRPLNIKRWHNAKGESTRDQLFLSEGEIDRIEPSKRELWRDITAALESDALRRAIFEKFRHDVAIRLRCKPADVPAQPIYPHVSLVRDYEDYRIKPHPDGEPRVITMLFYLPHGDTQSDLGTSLYKKQPLAHRLLGRPFKEIKRFPFLANSAGAFAVNDCAERQSYHGRELIGASAGVRDMIMVMWLSSPMTFAARHNAYEM